MDLSLTKKAAPLVREVQNMIAEQVIPAETEFFSEIEKSEQRFIYTSKMSEILESLKSVAKSKGLWNLWLTNSSKGHGLTTVEYAYLAEEM